MLEKTNISKVHRNKNSGALINTDMGELALYKLKKRLNREKNEKLNQVQSLSIDVEHLKAQVNDLTQIIKNIQERSN